MDLDITNEDYGKNDGVLKNKTCIISDTNTYFYYCYILASNAE